MTTSPNLRPPPLVPQGPLRLRLGDGTSLGTPDGAWWPRSRDLRTEAADLVAHFPESAGRIRRLLYSRPDWDESTTHGGDDRSIATTRGRVGVGSFPSDDTQLMVVTLSTGRRLRLLVIPSDTSRLDGERLLNGAGEIDAAPGDGADWDRWDDECPWR